MPANPPSTTPLPRKLGFNKPLNAALIAEPEGFRDLLGDLPAGTHLTDHISSATALVLCFVRTAAELTATVDLLFAQLPAGASAWVNHPKQHHRPDFNQNHVRDRALAAGLVDYKICSVSADWSGIKFARRKPSASTSL